MLEVVDAKYLSGFTVQLVFNDGTKGNVNLESSLWGPVFEPLKDISVFKQFTLSPILHTISWPNDADFAPEHLKTKMIEQSNAG
jgi:hypothetical protein